MVERPNDTVVETQRLWLRQWRADDVDPFRPITTDPQMMRYIRNGQLWTDDEIRFFIDREQKRQAAHGFSLWAMIHRETGELIGQAGLKHLGDTDMIEVGWWVAERHWGAGLATEAGRACLAAGFDRFGLGRIVAIAHPDNGASVRVMQKLGMRFVRNTTTVELGKPGGDPILLYEMNAEDPRG